MSKISEKSGVEVPIYDWLAEMGWKPKTNEQLKTYARAFSNPIIDGIPIERVAHINGVSLDAAKRAVDIPQSMRSTGPTRWRPMRISSTCYARA